MITHLDGPDDTRARILDVALDLFAEHGFAATSTREISDRLGFTKAALYYHFRTKDDLLDALLSPVMASFSELVSGASPRPSTSARRQVLTEFIDLVASNDKLIRVLTQDPSVTSRPMPATHKQAIERLTQLLIGTETPSAAERTRARATLGGVSTALLHAEPSDDPAIVREATLAAACGALGIPAPSHPQPAPSA